MAEEKIIKVLYPTAIVDSGEAPLIFLAGPIQGAPDWQEQASDIIAVLDPEIVIANPRQPLELADGLQGQDFYDQVDWETHYLRQAGKRGVIMFWLAKEAEHNCGRAYAQTSRFELGEWKEYHRRDSSIVVIGIEPGFTNERYLRHRLGQDCPEIAIFNTLEQTCRLAVKSCQALAQVEKVLLEKSP